MALKKTFTLPNGAVGTHFRVGPFRYDPFSREASAPIYIYANANVPKGEPLRERAFAKIRLSGSAFDAAHAHMLANGLNPQAEFYAAAKAGSVVCDFGSDFFKDAEDV